MARPLGEGDGLGPTAWQLALRVDPGARTAERDGFVPGWRGMRLVAADASTVRFGLRASHVKRAALANQILFGLFLPGPYLMLAASLHSLHERGERQFLVEHLDRGYPDDWLVDDAGFSLSQTQTWKTRRCRGRCRRAG